jgi:hypothetical protein
MIRHAGRMDLRMFPPGSRGNYMDAQAISPLEENVACRPHLKGFALDFEFHDASSRARDAKPS